MSCFGFFRTPILGALVISLPVLSGFYSPVALSESTSLATQMTKCNYHELIALEANSNLRDKLKDRIREYTILKALKFQDDVPLFLRRQLVKQVLTSHGFARIADRIIRQNTSTSEDLEALRDASIHFPLTLKEMDKIHGAVRARWRGTSNEPSATQTAYHLPWGTQREVFPDRMDANSEANSLISILKLSLDYPRKSEKKTLVRIKGFVEKYKDKINEESFTRIAEYLATTHPDNLKLPAYLRKLSRRYNLTGGQIARIQSAAKNTLTNYLYSGLIGPGVNLSILGSGISIGIAGLSPPAALFLASIGAVGSIGALMWTGLTRGIEIDLHFSYWGKSLSRLGQNPLSISSALHQRKINLEDIRLDASPPLIENPLREQTADSTRLLETDGEPK